MPSCWNDSGRWPTITSKCSPVTSASPTSGLDEPTWQRLADSVDLIVHPAAHVNHVLPYSQLFGPNVVGTAEIIRLAITARLKAIHYISTMGVTAVADHIVDEDSDIRRAVPRCTVADSYANGYGISKWAGEVLLREAHDLCALACRGVPAGHDPRRQPLRGAAQRARHVHPAAVQSRGHRHRAALVLPRQRR